MAECAGSTKHDGPEKHPVRRDCEQSVRTKCSLFDQRSRLITELADMMGNFDEGLQTDKILDPPFCWFSKKREQMGHTPKTQALLFPLCYPPEESRTVTTVSTRCGNIFIQTLFFPFNCTVLGCAHSFLTPKSIWLFEEKKYALRRCGWNIRLPGVIPHHWAN